MTEYALLLAQETPGMTMNQEMFRLACILHDVGKITVPDSILTKPGPLTPDEYRIMQSHAAAGHHLVVRTGASPEVAEVVRHHHERWDGTGYPDGLRGEQIPLGARVLAVADAFDAMTTHRPYRRARTPQEAYDEVLRAAGSQFDPTVVACWTRVFPRWAEMCGSRSELA